MPREFTRAERLADQIQKELAILIQREVKDPRVGMATVNAVKVSKDLGYADVYFTTLTSSELEEQEDGQAAEHALKGASGFLRGQLASRIKIRSIPHLRFHYDESIYRGRALSSLIDKAVEADEKLAEQKQDPSDS